MIDAGSPPDLVLDLSRGGDASEMIKTIVRGLGLPTVSSTMGGTKEIEKWSELSPSQENYLVQVRPPADLLPFLIRQMSFTLPSAKQELQTTHVASSSGQF